MQAQQLARTGKKLAAAPKPAQAVKAPKQSAAACDGLTPTAPTAGAEQAKGKAARTAERPASAGPGTPSKADEAAQPGSGPGSLQASSEATHVLTDVAGDQDADSTDARTGTADVNQLAPGKENAPAAKAASPLPAKLTPTKRPLQAKLPGEKGRKSVRAVLHITWGPPLQSRIPILGRVPCHFCALTGVT